MIPKCKYTRQLWCPQDFHILPGGKGILPFLQEFPSCDLGTAHSANSACRLAFGQTESYCVQPRLPVAVRICPASQLRVFLLLSANRILDGRARLYSSELSYSAVVINISSCKKEKKKKWWKVSWLSGGGRGCGGWVGGLVGPLVGQSPLDSLFLLCTVVSTTKMDSIVHNRFV